MAHKTKMRLLQLSGGLAAGNSAAFEFVDGSGASDQSYLRFDTVAGVSEFDAPIWVSGSIEVAGSIEVGHASDTSLTRSSAGVLAVEGNVIYAAGGTDVPVSDGGTGASSFTDGGVLLGSGTGAVTAMAVLTDGQMIVGDGSTDPVAESGATLRTSIGVGTTDSPQFAGLTVESSASNMPLVILKNEANDALGARLRFVKDKGAAGADGDDVGSIEWLGDDAGQNATPFGKILVEVSEADDTDEAGKMSLFVAESDGTDTALTAGLILEGEHATDGQVDVTIGAGAASTTTIAGEMVVTGDLTVNGTTTTVNQTIIESTVDVLVFEGASADAHETTLKVVEPTADCSFALPTLTAGDYFIPAITDTATDASTAVTATEFALLDGGSSVATVTVVDNDGVLFNDGGTMKQVTVQSLAAYYDDEITAMPNLATIGKAAATTDIAAGDLTMYNAVNDGNPTIRVGKDAADSLGIAVSYASGAQTLQSVEFSTASSTANADDGRFIFDVDGTDIVTIGDAGLELKDNATIGSVSDNNLLTLGNAILTVAGEVSMTTLDIGGTDVTATAGELSLLDGDVANGVSITIGDTDGILVDDGGTMKKVPASDLKTFIGSGQTTKGYTTIASAVAADDNVSVPTINAASWGQADISAATDREIYLNGQLLMPGADAAANKDWYNEGTTNGIVRFEFGLEIGDVLTFVLRA